LFREEVAKTKPGHYPQPTFVDELEGSGPEEEELMQLHVQRER
jgi:hypothetical protein